MTARGIIRPHHSKFEMMFKVSDICLITMAYVWIFGAERTTWQGTQSITLLLAAAGFYFAASMNDVYLSWRMAPIRRELGRVAYSWVISLFVQFLGALFFGLFDEYPRQVVLQWAVGGMVLLVLWHAFVRVVSREMRRRGQNSRRVAFLGVTDTALELAETMKHQSWMGLNVVGFYDDRKPGEDGRTAKIDNHEYLGGFEDALEASRTGELDLAFMALPFRAEQRIGEIADALADTTVALYYAHDYRTLDLLTGRLFMLGDVMVVSMRENPFQGVDGLLKRLEDVILSCLILLFIGIPCAVIALAVKLTSPGPILFKQTRYGLNGKAITVWKFRTMTVMEDGDTVRQAQAGDDRITPLGRFLRRTSLDELPQFINVLKGDMSIVGPRPHAVAHNEKYRKLVKSYMLRHTIKPGITGWAQVNGWRGETDTQEKMEKRIEYDLDYIKNWSIFLDLKIIVLTVLRGFTDKNAY